VAPTSDPGVQSDSLFDTDILHWLSNPDNLEPTAAPGGTGRADGLSATDGTMFPWLDVS
jgi:hypothetical protein